MRAALPRASVVLVEIAASMPNLPLFLFAALQPYLGARPFTPAARAGAARAPGAIGGLPVTNTIALVDDDRNILTSVSMALEAEGFAVRCYSDGAEALQGLTRAAGRSRRARHQDAAHGRHGAARPAAQAEAPMPVIFLTSKDDEVDELLGLRMGADDYIKKPFSQRLLIERIRALLRRGELARERDDGAGRAGRSCAAS